MNHCRAFRLINCNTPHKKKPGGTGCPRGSRARRKTNGCPLYRNCRAARGGRGIGKRMRNPDKQILVGRGELARCRDDKRARAPSRSLPREGVCFAASRRSLPLSLPRLYIPIQLGRTQREVDLPRRLSRLCKTASGNAARARDRATPGPGVETP